MPPIPETSHGQTRVDLSRFSPGDYDSGRSFVIRSLWFFLNALILKNPFNPLSRLKVSVLRLFGAKIGEGVYIKPGVSVKFPWYLSIGDHCWIGEDVWIDNLVPVTIGANVCLSQDVYLCTGNHDWADPTMGYRLSPIEIEDGAWVCARATILPGVKVGNHAIVSAGAVLSRNAEAWMIYIGNPAVATKKRQLKSAPDLAT